jgi:UDP-sulfoquinovose synthase
VNVLITGFLGYIGFPLTLRLLESGHTITGIDSEIKFKWLQDLNSYSAIKLQLTEERIVFLMKQFYDKFDCYCLDVSKNLRRLKLALKSKKYDVIINLAQQPSAGYSQLSLKTATETIINNQIGTLNLLWYIKKYQPDTHFIEIESFGVNQHDINTDTPEGLFQFQLNGRTSEPCIFPKRPGSFYHNTKVANLYMNDMANRFWDISSTIINQSIVYGNYTPEIDKYDYHTGLYSDSEFGTVINRFIVQSALKEKLTVYGDGEHSRGFLALNDSIQALEIFVNNPPKKGEMRQVNQLSEVYTMNQIAEKVNSITNVGIVHIPSPRVENTSNHYYNPIYDTLNNLGFKQTRIMEEEIKYSLEHIDYNNLEGLRSLVIPKVYWNG